MMSQIQTYKKIVFFGCSFTFGHDSGAPARLDNKQKPYPGPAYEQHNIEQTYPSHIGKMLENKYEIVNLGNNGISNAGIYIDLFNFIKSNSLKNTLVIINWTSKYRDITALDYNKNKVDIQNLGTHKFDDKLRYVNLYFNNRPLENYVEKFPNGSTSKSYENFIHQEEHIRDMNVSAHMRATANLLDMNNIPWLGINMLVGDYFGHDKNYFFNYTDVWQETVDSLCDYKDCIYTDWCKLPEHKKNELTSLYSWHPNGEGYQWIAEKLFPTISQKLNSGK